MRTRIVLLAAMLATPTLANEAFTLPPEVTPALRAACEQDVRRHCVGENPSYEKVKRCVEQKHGQFGARCRMALVTAGFSR
jgi:hypothetical protein